MVDRKLPLDGLPLLLLDVGLTLTVPIYTLTARTLEYASILAHKLAPSIPVYSAPWEKERVERSYG